MIRTLLITAATLLAVTPAVARDVSKFDDSTFNRIAAGTLALQAGGITCADGATCDVTPLSVAPKGFTPKTLGAWLSPAGVQSLLNGVLPNLGTNIFGDPTNRQTLGSPALSRTLVGASFSLSVVTRLHSVRNEPCRRRMSGWRAPRRRSGP